MSECVGKEKPAETPPEPETPTDETDSEKSSGNAALLVVLGGGGATLYCLKFKKSKPDAKGPIDLDDYDYGDEADEDLEDEEVPEDMSESEDSSE